MAIKLITATFRAIENFGINAQGEIVELEVGGNLNNFFDLLVEVQWTSGPKVGQTGWLLCSHYCKFPLELLPHADFIEGCFTPKELQNDPRLVLGNHCQQVTSYEWEGAQVKISVNLGGNPDIDETHSFQRVVQKHELPTCKGFRRFYRLGKRFLEDAIEHGLSSEEGFSALEQRWSEWQEGQDERLHLSAFLFSYMLGALEVENLAPNGRLSMELEEYGEFCEVHGNKVTVIRNSGQFQMAESIPLKKTQEGLEVLFDLPGSGFFMAVELIMKYEYSSLTVLKDLPEEGFFKATPLGEGKIETLCEDMGFEPWNENEIQLYLQSYDDYDYSDYLDEEDEGFQPSNKKELGLVVTKSGKVGVISEFLPYSYKESFIEVKMNLPHLGFYKALSIDHSTNQRRERRRRQFN